MNTAIPPLSDGSSNPSLFNVAMNARALGYQTMIDEDAVKPVRDHFTRVAKQENLPIGRPLEYDAFHPLHQVPGGMISNFRFQLGNLGKLDQLPAVLEEVSRVRAEFGFPIMVTPYSQFFGVQAAINVMVGARYKEVTDEVLLYAMGYWGEEEALSIEANLRDRLVSSARAKELAQLKIPEITLPRISREIRRRPSERRRQAAQLFCRRGGLGGAEGRRRAQGLSLQHRRAAGRPDRTIEPAQRLDSSLH